MKKFILMLVAVAAIGFTSCEKCSTCTVSDEDGNVITAYPEVCGSKSDIDTYETTAETAAAAVPGYTVSCTND